MEAVRESFAGGWVETEGDLVHLRFDGTRANALTRARYDALARTARALGPEAVWCISSHGSTFSAGQDTSELVAALDDGTVEDLLRRGTDAVQAVLQTRATVVAAVHGPAVGGGALLAAAADVVVMSRSARMRLPELELGMPLGASVMERLVGGPAARRLALTGAWAESHEVAALGGVELVDTHEPEATLAQALHRSRALLSVDPAVRGLARSLFGSGEKERCARLYAREAAATIAHLR